MKKIKMKRKAICLPDHYINEIKKISIEKMCSESAVYREAVQAYLKQKNKRS